MMMFSTTAMMMFFLFFFLRITIIIFMLMVMSMTMFMIMIMLSSGTCSRTGIVLFFLIDWKPKLYFSINRAKPLLKFGMNILAADFVGTIFNQLNTFIIGKKYSVEQLAYYNRGQSFPYLVNGNMCSVLANVLYPAFSAESNNDDKLVSMARKTVRLSVYALSPLFL